LTNNYEDAYVLLLTELKYSEQAQRHQQQSEDENYQYPAKLRAGWDASFGCGYQEVENEAEASSSLQAAEATERSEALVEVDA